MLLRRDSIVAFASEFGASCYRRSAVNGRPRLLCETPIAPLEGADSTSAGDTSARVAHSIRAACHGVVTKLSSARIELVLSWSLAPGCVVDLGDGTLPNRIRSELAMRRVAEQFSLNPADWRVRVQSDRIAGSVLAFAVRATLADAIARMADEGRLKIVSVVPALIWTLNQHGREFVDRWLAIRDGERLIVADVQAGLCRSIDAVGAVGDDEERSLWWTVRRTAWIQGFDEPRNPIGLIRLTTPFEMKSLIPPKQGSASEGERLPQ